MTESFMSLVGERDPSELGNNELVEALSYIEDISEFLGEVDDKVDVPLFMGMLEEIVALYMDKLTGDIEDVK